MGDLLLDGFEPARIDCSRPEPTGLRPRHA
jgi:hypothetical protein